MPLIKTWMSLLPEAPDLSLTGSHHVALWACWSPYRLPDETVRWMLDKPRDYFIRMGHGPDSSPEIYSGGPGWLLSAGGVNRGKRSLIVARPITLLLNDGATDLSQVLHLAGPGDDFRAWNNTGVWKNFAAAAGPVHVPADWKPVAEGALWTVYRQGGLSIVIHSHDDLGIVYIDPTDDPKTLLETVDTANADAERLNHAFQVPGGDLVEYDVAASKSRWVITKVNNRPVDRKFDRWPRLEEE